MSVEAEFQKHIRDLLIGNAAVAGFVTDRVYDSVPESKDFPYISFGPHEVIEDDADGIECGEHTLQLDVWTKTIGVVEAKRIVSAVRKALHRNTTEMTVNAIVTLEVSSTRVFPDPNPPISHGVITLTANIEEK